MRSLALIICAAILVAPPAPAHARTKSGSCHAMRQLAQEHANDMARRERLDHAGFAARAARGARAENVAMGYPDSARTLAQWRASPGHAANLRLRGCKAIARAVSRSGRVYWAMVIGR